MTRWRLAILVAVAGALVLASAETGSAATTYGSPYQVTLDSSTPTPITAATFSPQASCGNYVLPYEDGWHFVAPGGSTVMVSLSATFSSAVGALTTSYANGRQEAYVASLPGAQLTAASATVETATGQTQIQAIELANTCPATAALPSSWPTGAASPLPSWVFPSASLPTGADVPIPSSVPLTNTSSAKAATTKKAEPDLATCTPAASASATVSPSDFTTSPSSSQSASPSSSDTSSASPSTSGSASSSPSASSTASSQVIPEVTTSDSSSASPSASASGSASPSTSGSASASASGSASASSSCDPGSGSSGSSPSPSASVTSPAPSPSAVSSSLAVTG